MMKMSLLCSLFVVTVVQILYAKAISLPTAADYEIKSLPLLNEPINFKQYAGYMPIGDEDETALFFWFVESQDDPANDPMAMWLNGGPGSSSIEYGFWSEHGPFRLTPNAESVELYEYSWNLHANVVYVESPSGVGFSYSNKSTGYQCTDEKSANINYHFLLNFFQVFPQFQANDFYVTGESYGGHYVPQLSQQILENDNNINMKGFWIGNPGINSDWYYNVNEYAFQTFLWSHALLPQSAYVKSVEACDWDDFLTNCSKDFTNPDTVCRAANTEAYAYVPRTWDPYNVYAPTCHRSVSAHHTLPNETSYLEEKYGKVMWRDTVKEMSPGLEALRQKYFDDSEYVYNPCMNQWTPQYMNRPDVLDAIHASAHYTRTWPNHPSGWSYGTEKEDIALLFPEFFSKAPQWKISVVSGDADAAVPFMGTERWITCLEQPVAEDWFNWYMDGDVAGSVKVYKGITFQSIKGCGHTIPTYCPKQGYLMWEQYLNGDFNVPAN